MKAQRLNKRRFIGVLCFHGHEHEDTGGSLRYKACRTCCVCNALSVLDRKGEHEKYRHEPYNKMKMDKYQKNYKKNYRDKGKKVNS